MSSLICFHCFKRFRPSEIWFKCLGHGDVPHQFPYIPQRGSGARAAVRRWFAARTMRRPASTALCNHRGPHSNGDDADRCYRLSGYRLCPDCKQDLPHYLGRSPQKIVAVAGCQGSGKTVYLWSLLWQLRHVHARSDRPFVSAMFEDDVSFKFYQELNEALTVRRRVPRWTNAAPQREGRLPPVIARLMGDRLKGRFNNLVFYDHAGELIEAVKDVRYLRYLTHAAALLFLVDPDNDPKLPAVGLDNVIKRIKDEAGNGAINKPLAVIVTKADGLASTALRQQKPEDVLIEGASDAAKFWNRWGSRESQSLDRSSRILEDYCRSELKLENFCNIARDHFPEVRYFAVSSLGQQPDPNGYLARSPVPLGVEHPLFWALRSMPS